MDKKHPSLAEIDAQHILKNRARSAEVHSMQFHDRTTLLVFKEGAVDSETQGKIIKLLKKAGGKQKQFEPTDINSSPTLKDGEFAFYQGQVRDPDLVHGGIGSEITLPVLAITERLLRDVQQITLGRR